MRVQDKLSLALFNLKNTFSKNLLIFINLLIESFFLILSNNLLSDINYNMKIYNYDKAKVETIYIYCFTNYFENEDTNDLIYRHYNCVDK